MQLWIKNLYTVKHKTSSKPASILIEQDIHHTLLYIAIIYIIHIPIAWFFWRSFSPSGLCHSCSSWHKNPVISLWSHELNKHRIITNGLFNQVQKHFTLVLMSLTVGRMNKWLQNRNECIRAPTMTHGSELYICLDLMAYSFPFLKIAFSFLTRNDAYVFTDAEGLYFSQFLLDGGSLGVPQHLYRMHMDVDDTGSLAPPQSHSPSRSHSPCETQRPQRISPSVGSVRHADSISLSEDEVFYNWSFNDTGDCGFV